MAVFIDTSYLVALAIINDQYHEKAVSAATLNPGPYLTTEAILLEVGNAFSKQKYKETGSALIQDVLDDPDIEVLPIHHDLFRRALDLYTNRQDKDWSLTDCLSFVVMEERGLEEALTSDRHYVEAGYRALMV